MKQAPNPQINLSKIAVGGGIAGAIFTIGSMLIFLIGIPLLRYVFPAAILLGCLVALILRFIRHDTPGKSWLLSSMENETESLGAPSAASDEWHLGGHHGHKLNVRIQWQARHVKNGFGHIPQLHARLDLG